MPPMSKPKTPARTDALERGQGSQDGPENADRRRFLGLVGASAAAGAVSLHGCRKPVEHIFPYTNRPENLIPGRPLHFATSLHVGTAVLGVLIESQEGRPTKVEGNPFHPMSNPLGAAQSKHGGANAWAQASVLSLYDDDRLSTPYSLGSKVSWDDLKKSLGQAAVRLSENDGDGTAFLVQSLPSPTFQALLGKFVKDHGKAKVYYHDPAGDSNARAGAAMVGASGLTALPSLDKANVIVAVDSDFLGTEGDSVRNARLFIEGRRIANPKITDIKDAKMNRLYAIEPNFTLTGSMADNRLALSASQTGAFLAAVARELKIAGVPDASLKGGTAKKWVSAITKDLLANKGKGLVLVGERQPAHVHALAHLINDTLGNVGADKPIRYVANTVPSTNGGLGDLAKAILNGKVQTLVIFGGNPAYNGPGHLGFDTVLEQVPMSIYLGLYRNETAKKCSWNIPQSHAYEAWGDLQAADGTMSIQQPLIAPLYKHTMSTVELMGSLLGTGGEGYRLVQDFHKGRVTSAQKGDLIKEAEAAQKTAEINLQAAQDAVKEASKPVAAPKPPPEPAPDAAEGGTGGDANPDAEGVQPVVKKPTPKFVDNSAAIAAAKAAVGRTEAALTKARHGLIKAKAQVETDKKKAESKFNKNWRRWLHDGVIAGSTSNGTKATLGWEKTPKAFAPGGWPKANVSGLELNLHLDSTVCDGRFGNHPWLQELPDPITKLTWDNAACISPTTATKADLKLGDLVELNFGGKTLTLPVLPVAGLAADVVAVALGYGQHNGRTAKGVGFDAYSLQAADGTWFGGGATLSKTPRTYPLARTQTHGRLEPRPGWKARTMVRQQTLEGKDGYKSKPGETRAPENLAKKLMHTDKFRSLWKEPNPRDGQQWGMSINLNACIGCGACTIACQSENNISTVGKEEVLNGREMHWIRVDRYFTGNPDEPSSSAVFQPVPCAHCETAPCENVCPVAATTHSPDGLNDMAYNRCIGTRYCANNCPTKVRRYNFYNYSKRNDESLGSLIQMQRNPDVTVRFRGVMEKCTYCVQRINEAKIKAKRDGTGFIPDDDRAVTACEQSCPTRAIVFGDINDPKSEIFGLRPQYNERAYGLLEELNLHPRTTYLSKLRNPNPELKVKS
jgi:Fe-S-cluster-containing dehydrogenase component